MKLREKLEFRWQENTGQNSETTHQKQSFSLGRSTVELSGSPSCPSDQLPA